MARYRRRKLFRFRLKKQSLYTIVSIGLIVAAFLIMISFFQTGTALELIRTATTDTFGWGGIVFPFVLVSFALLFLRLKSPIAQPNVALGLLLSYMCILALGQSGIVGIHIWNSFAGLVSGIGAGILLLGILFVGLVVLCNMSMEELGEMAGTLIQKFRKASSVLPLKKAPSPFVEKLPIHSVDFRKEYRKLREKDMQKREEEDQRSSIAPLPPHLNASLVTNVPSQNRVWEYPSFTLLSSSPGQKADRGDLKQNAHIIEKTLESFGVSARIVEVNLGPAVTQYALEIALGTKVSKITALANDLALALAAPTGQIRIEAPIPGRSLVGIEIPNRSLEFVTLRHMISSNLMKRSREKLLVALGLDVSGNPVIANLAKMPHVLIAGTTGSGKSVLMNTWITSLLFRTSPTDVRLILVDPKRVELIGYNGIPHLLTPVIVEPDKILSALKWAMQEMDRRYKLFAEVGVRNIDGYNELSGFQAIPYIVILIDELADLMAYAAVEVEDAICRIAQMARATGIHLVLATQRPSVDVITGLIKANVPSRIAFNVSSMIDSRVILDMPGAEKLLGRGDMLYIPPDQAKPTRIQGTYVSEQEVTKIVEFLKTKNQPVEYTQEVTSVPVGTKKSSATGQGSDDGKDALFEQAVRVVCQYDRASASLLQRRLSIGYARAARVIDQLESEGIISAGEGSKPRDVLVKNPEEYLTRRKESAPTAE